MALAEAVVEPPMPEKPSFKSYGLKATKRFLKTAIVIDDEIIAEAPNETPVQAEAPPFAVPAEGAPAVEVHTKPNDAEVPIKPLADAFLDKQIVCGVLKPEAADDDAQVVDRAVRAAAVADVVIIDWYLKKTNDKLAKKILTQILKDDRERNGRLRLVLVYTSATPLDTRRDNLSEHLKAAGFEVARDPNDDTLLAVASCRIKFVQKRSLNSGTPVEALPELAIEEFAKHSSGLLANFALLGIAALRDATHHVLANLTGKMDAAFVGHRMLLKDSVGAQGFAMTLFMLQMKSVMSLPAGIGAALADDEVSAWLEERFSYADAAAQLAVVGTDKDKLLSSITLGEGKLDVAHKALFLPDTVAAPADVGKVEKAASQEFSRFVTFVREKNGFNPLPIGWTPTLTLGSIVRLEGRKARYFLCVQPACDTVRLEQEMYFPFVELVATKISSSTDNLTVRDGTKSVLLAVGGKAGSRHYAKFKPKADVKAVVAEPGENDGFAFESVQEHVYWWLGDIDPMKAQRIAVDLASTLARVGIDEYEWLRRGGTAKS